MPELRVIEGGRSRASRFEALIGAHYDVLYRVAYRLTRAAPDAEDLVQEVCVRAFPRLDELESLEDPRGWMLLVMRRIFIDQARRYDSRYVESIETNGEVVSDEPGPMEETDRLCRSEWLDRAWVHLEPEYRSLLSLHDLEGYSLAEIQGMTGLKIGTLKSRLHRARAKLGRLLQSQQQPTQLRWESGERK